MGAHALALPFFALTLFVSAFLLFLVQPMIGKMILPRLGGTPQVWNTCMVFFQTTLLAGYAYTHMVSTRMKIKSQLLLHGIMLLLPLLMLFGLGTFYSRIADFKPITGGNPIPVTLVLLTGLVGLPFLVVATSAPLLQRWFAHTGHPAAQDPYFLYGASNLGSFLSLLAYPFIIEPTLGLSTQSWTWTIGYTTLVVLVLGCAAMVMMAPPSVSLPKEKTLKESAPKETVPPVEEKKEEAIKAGAPGAGKITSFKKGGKQFRKEPEKRKLTTKHEPATPVSVTHHRTHDPRLAPVTPARRLRWIALAAVPSSLMLGVTTYATTDLSPIPLLWLIPLMLYLISFVLVFARWPVVWVEKPHNIMVWIQPFALAAMIMIMVVGPYMSIWFGWPIAIHIFAFFITTMVCHGELAKDRPAPEHLTEFYLLMSVGGMLGGIFNALVAPVLFVYVIEYGLAIFLAGLLRPQMGDVSWLDQFFEGMLGGRSRDKSASPANVPLVLDFALPIIMFFVLGLLTFLLGGLVQTLLKNILGIGQRGGEAIPFLVFIFSMSLLLSLLFMDRPIRYGLTLGVILLVQAVYNPLPEAPTIYSDRSYFGILRVKQQQEDRGQYYTTLIHGHINHGMNFRKSEGKDDYSRLATTYYHRLGPAGRVMELYNWFPGPQNTYTADVRAPASLFALIGSATMPVPTGPLPLDPLVGLWAEPPYATIGLGTGTMASYARPFQHMHYYEIDKHVVRLSIPTANGPYYQNSKEPLFTYLQEAKETRGADIWILMGDARLRMAQPFSGPEDYSFSDWTDAVCKKYQDNRYNIMVVDGDVGGGSDNFYHMMVVDAFSSDAIPVHLLTKESVEMYFDKLTVDGILCVHTSNRYVNLVPVVGDIAKEVTLKKRTATGAFIKDENGNYVTETIALVAKRGHDNAPGKEIGHFTSEWVMVARSTKAIEQQTPIVETDKHKKTRPLVNGPEGYDAQLREQYAKESWDPTRMEPYWETAATTNNPPWTDDFSNLIAAIRWGSR